MAGGTMSVIRTITLFRGEDVVKSRIMASVGKVNYNPPES